MIRRDDHDHWLLIPQIEHARLAAEIARHWGNDHTAALPVAGLLVEAVRHHDDGWHEWDRPAGTGTLSRLDPETGWPRGFTEMRMADATVIWSRSIQTCLQGDYSHAEVFSRLGDREVTPALAQLVDAVLTFRTPFTADDLLLILERQTGQAHSRAEVYLGLNQLQYDGIVQPDADFAATGLFRLSVPPSGRAVLPAIWVSRHFCFLAERAREHRREDPDESTACEAFLDEQARLQQEWQAELAGSQDDEQLRVLKEAGFRFVQLFDRLSLWLCMAERTQPTVIEIPFGDPLQLIPAAPMAFRLEPFPLSVESLTLQAVARRLPVRSYTSESEFLRELHNAETERLEWTLQRD